MRSLTKIIALILVLTLGLASAGTAQQSAQERAASLRLQLAETQARQDELKARLQELDEALKPENIASALAGIGSVHPEELREQRRREMTRERTDVNAQLDRLAVSRSRLETELRKAEADAYHQSAAPTPVSGNPKGPNATNAENRSTPVRPVIRRRARQVKRQKSKKPIVTVAPSNR